MATALAFVFDAGGLECMNLQRFSGIENRGHAAAILLQRIDEYKLGGDNSGSLKVHSSPMIIVDIVDLQHCRVDVSRKLGKEPLEVGEKRWIIERPLRGVLHHTIRALPSVDRVLQTQQH